MKLENQQLPHYTFLKWYIYQVNVLLKKGYKEATKPHISWALYWFGIESNNRTALSYISWFL